MEFIVRKSYSFSLFIYLVQSYQTCVVFKKRSHFHHMMFWALFLKSTVTAVGRNDFTNISAAWERCRKFRSRASPSRRSDAIARNAVCSRSVRASVNFSSHSLQYKPSSELEQQTSGEYDTACIWAQSKQNSFPHFKQAFGIPTSFPHLSQVWMVFCATFFICIPSGIKPMGSLLQLHI
jgi:hypothetical protein